MSGSLGPIFPTSADLLPLLDTGHHTIHTITHYHGTPRPEFRSVCFLFICFILKCYTLFSLPLVFMPVFYFPSLVFLFYFLFCSFFGSFFGVPLFPLFCGDEKIKLRFTQIIFNEF